MARCPATAGDGSTIGSSQARLNFAPALSSVFLVLGRVDSCVLAGLDVRRVHVEADIARGGDGKFSLVGLAATTVKEARQRVRSAPRNRGPEFPNTRRAGT